MVSCYDVKIRAIKRIQRKFLKYITYKQSGVYPHQGYEHNMPLQQYGFLSLSVRRELASLSFLHHIMNNVINCFKRPSQFSFLVPRLNARQRAKFYCPKTRTFLLKNSVYIMCTNFIRISSVSDVHVSSILDLHREP